MPVPHCWRGAGAGQPLGRTAPPRPLRNGRRRDRWPLDRHGEAAASVPPEDDLQAREASDRAEARPAESGWVAELWGSKTALARPAALPAFPGPRARQGAVLEIGRAH